MGKRILVVDDSTIMRRILVDALTQAGHEIIGEAKTGEDAVKLYKELSPDLVTMDITMRGMDGITAAKEIFKFNHDAKILILSNLDENKYHDEVMKIGALGLVNKHKTETILHLVEQ